MSFWMSLAAGNEMNLDAVVETHASATKRTKKKTFSKTVTINESHHDTVHGSTLLAGGDILINAQKTEEGIAIQQTGDVNLRGAYLQADGNMVLAGNDINIEAQSYTDYEMEYKFKSRFGGLSSKEQLDAKATEKLHGSTLLAGGTNGAQGNLSIIAGDDASIVASELHSAGNTTLSVFDELVVASGEEIEQIDKVRKSGGLFSGGSLYSLKESVSSTRSITADSSVISAGGNLHINTGSALVIGSDLSAEGNLVAKTDIGDIEVKAAKEGTFAYQYDKEVKVGLGDVLSNPTEIMSVEDGKVKVTLASADYDEVEVTANETTHRSSNLTANGNVVLDSVGDIFIEGSNIIADANANGDGDVGLIAGGNVTVKEATNEFEEQRDETHGEAALSVVVQNNYVEAAKAIEQVDEAASQLKQAEQDYRKYQKELSTLEGTLAQLKSDYEAGVSGTDYNDIKDLEALVDDLKDDEEFYQAGIALATVNLASKTTLAAQQTAAAFESTGTYGFDVGVQLDINATQTQTHTQATTSHASQISGENITVVTGVEDENSFGQSGSTLIQGSTLAANNNLTIATETLDVLASRDTFRQTVDSQNASISVQQTVYGSSTGGPSVNASYGQSRSEDRSTTYNNSVLTAENINIATAGDASFIGANVDASNDLTLSVGGDLWVESQQNRSSGSNHSFGVNAGVGFGGGDSAAGLGNSYQNVGSTNGEVSSVSGGLNVSNGRYANKETVLTTLTSGNTATINVEGNTQIVGALIATLDDEGNDLGNLALTTGSLDFINLKERSYNSQTGFSVNTNVGVSQGANPTDPASQVAANPQDSDTSLNVNSSNISINTSTSASGGTTYATIGEGTVVVGDAQSEENLAAINRDVDNVTEELYNTETGMSVDATIDHRLFSEEGRKAILEDFKRSEIGFESIADVLTKDSVSLFGDGEGETSLAENIANNQNYFSATKQFALDPSNAAHIETLTNADATFAEKQAAYTALANSVAVELGIPLVEAKVLVVSDPRFGGAYSEGTTNIYVNDLATENAGDAVSTVGHEITHHLQNQQDYGDLSDVGEANLEEYATLMGERTEDFLSFNFAQEGFGDLSSGNNHNWGNSAQEVSNNINLIGANTQTFLSENPEDLDFKTIFVHGTFSNPSGADAEFIQGISETFGEEVFQFDWSGDGGFAGATNADGADNSEAARKNAGLRLAKIINEHFFEDGETLNLIGHSHGGNVIKEAINNYTGEQEINSVIFLATPHREDHRVEVWPVTDAANLLNVYDNSDLVQLLGMGLDSPSGDLGNFEHIKVEVPNEGFIPIFTPLFGDHSDIDSGDVWNVIRWEINNEQN